MLPVLSETLLAIAAILLAFGAGYARGYARGGADGQRAMARVCRPYNHTHPADQP